ncbi:hypothetical protein IAT40_007951 [Kwoniella sp. CBS 6097]
MRLRSSARPAQATQQPSTQTQELTSQPHTRAFRATTAPPSLFSPLPDPTPTPTPIPAPPSRLPPTATATSIPAHSLSSTAPPPLFSSSSSSSSPRDIPAPKPLWTSSRRSTDSGTINIHLTASPTPTPSDVSRSSPSQVELEAARKAGILVPLQLSLTIYTPSSRRERGAAAAAAATRKGGMRMTISTQQEVPATKRRFRLDITTTLRPKSKADGGSCRRSTTVDPIRELNLVNSHVIQRGPRFKTRGSLSRQAEPEAEPAAVGAMASLRFSGGAANPHVNVHGFLEDQGRNVAVQQHERDEVDDDLDAVEQAVSTESSVHLQTTAESRTLNNVTVPEFLSRQPAQERLPPPPPIARHLKILCDARTLAREVKRYLIAHPAFSADYGCALRDLLARDWSYLPIEYRPTSLTHLRDIADTTRQRIISIHALFHQQQQQHQLQQQRPHIGAGYVVSAIPVTDQHPLLRLLYYVDAIKRPVDHLTPEEARWLITIGMNKGHIPALSLEAYDRHTHFVNALIHCHDGEGERCFHPSGHMNHALAEIDPTSGRA